MNIELIKRFKHVNFTNITRKLSLLNIQTVDSNRLSYNNKPRLNNNFKTNNITKRYNSTEPNDVNSVVDIILDSSSTEIIENVVTPEKVNFIIENVMKGLDQIHVLCGIPYWEAIIIATIGIRILMFPVALKTIQGSSRMAAMRPEMQKVQNNLLNNNNANDPRFKKQYENEMKALFAKYKVNPIHSVLWPLSQFPIFIALFMALRDMGNFYPDFATGGTLWFTNLAIADPYLLWPIFNSLSFLAMVEIGADGIQVNQQNTFKWAMRGLSLVIIPVTMSMPQGLFLYWGTNNTLSIIQAIAMKQDSVRKFFDIPKPPAVEDTPIFKPINPITIITKAIEQERAKSENAKAEILDGISSTPPGPPKVAVPPVSFALPPKKKKTLNKNI